MKEIKLPQCFHYPLAGLLGACGALGFAPFHWMWAPCLSLYGLMKWQEQSRQPFVIGLCYGVGYFALGVSWIYSIIHDYGHAPAALACLASILFIAVFALFHGFALWGYHKLFPQPRTLLQRVLGFPAIWIAIEFIRGEWFWVGFPCLLVGYSGVDSWWKGWAPVGSVYWVGWVLLFMSCLLGEMLFSIRKLQTQLLASLIWLISLSTTWALNGLSWTQLKSEKDYSVSLIQGNIPQSVKFDPQWINPSLELYAQRTAQEHDADLIIWPETALPVLPQQVPHYLEDLDAWGKSNEVAILIGAPTLTTDKKFRNSIQAHGTGTGQYDKQRLLPVGEYNPFGWLLKPLMNVLDIPLSDLEPGEPQQNLLKTPELNIAPLICYEIVYPDLASKLPDTADVIVTLSNDTWFGHTSGPAQHLQIAQMRALETGRYILRATNNGMTAVIDPQGNVLSQAPSFTEDTLRSSFQAFHGQTPVQKWGIYPVFIFCLGWIVFLSKKR